MDLAWLSLAALIAVIVVSCTTSVNPGLVAITLAWGLGVYVAPAMGHTIGAKGVSAGFPSDLFLTLVGITFFFAQAQANGTLGVLAGWAVRACRGRAALLPLAFFLLTFVLATLGAGNIAAAALLAPPAMAAARRANIPAGLMAVLVAHGAIAGALSPIAPTGILAGGLMERMGLGGHGWTLFGHNLLANGLAGLLGYVVFGGLRLLRTADPVASPPEEVRPAVRVGRAHGVTLCLILLLVVGALLFQVQVGMAAFAAGVLLGVVRLADEGEAFRLVPWSTIVMVCGVTVLTALLEKTGGLDLFTSLTARVATRESITGVIAGVTGLLSVYSSTAGVVLPALLPTAAGLSQKLGGADALAIAYSINVGGHLVDVSPLSTIGALCVAAIPDADLRRRVVNHLLFWGLGMALTGAVYCWVVFTPRT